MKKAVEAYWAGKLSADELTKAAAEVKKASWTSLKEQGVDLIPRFVPFPIFIDPSALNMIHFPAVTSPSTTTSLTTLLPSTSSPSVTLATACRPSMSTSPWAVGVRPTVLMFPPLR